MSPQSSGFDSDSDSDWPPLSCCAYAVFSNWVLDYRVQEQPALIIFKLENYAPFAVPFPAPPSGQFILQWLHRLFIYLFLFAEAQTHSRAHPPLPHLPVGISMSQNCNRLSDERVALAVSKPLPLLLLLPLPLPPPQVASDSVCLAHGIILCSHCSHWDSTLTLKCFALLPIEANNVY